MAQGCLQGACHVSLDSPSPFSCFTRLCFCLPCFSLTVTSRPLPTATSLTLTSTTSRIMFRTWKAQVKRTPNEDELSGYLAKSAFNRRLWAQEVRQDHICGQWHDDHWRSRPRYLRLFENHRKNIGQFGVSAVFEFSVSHVSHWWFCFSERKQRKHATGKQLRLRELVDISGPLAREAAGPAGAPGKGQNSDAGRSGRLECFQRKTSGFCSNGGNCNFLLTHATGRRETMWKEVKNARKSHPEQASSSGPKVKERTDVKNSNSLKASPATRVKKIPCLWLTRWKRSSCNYRHHPVCRGLQVWETGAFVAFVAFFRHAGWEVTSARVREKKVLKAQLLLWEKKQTSKVVFLKTQIQWVLFYGKLKNWDWTLRRDTPEILRTHLVRN